MRKKYPDNPTYEEPDNRWRKDKEVESKFLSKEEILYLQEVFNRPENQEEISDRRQLRKLNALIKLLTGKAKRIKSVSSMSEALTMLLMPLEHHWIFIENNTADVLVPYFIDEVRFVPTSQYNPQHIEVRGIAVYRGKKKKLERNIYREAFGDKGCTAAELMEKQGWYPETPELIAEYEEHMEKYYELAPQTGLQLVGHGRCNIQVKSDTGWGSRYEDQTINLDKGGIQSKVVIDDLEDDEDGDERQNSQVISTDMWNAKHGEDGEEEDVYKLPVHPFIEVFSLKLHEFTQLHVKNVEVYEYEEGLEDKLVLENDKRELIDLLVSSGGDDSRDIVQGKSGGVIIITSGPPGTGKTLTAEVYAEKVKRPLYVVQCSQLGTNSDDLEKTLSEVLERAVRWEAVLLIDEADVYIHERGDDIQQNAIVGVFLRVLEYYSGVLFLTTNRACVIDDAIESRCIAHVKYTIPKPSELEELWRILSRQYDVPFPPGMCQELAKTFPSISGRSVKQLIRLGKALALSRGEEITVDTIAWVVRFQHIEVTEATQKKFPVVTK
jgi:hypothetical protein